LLLSWLFAAAQNAQSLPILATCGAATYTASTAGKPQTGYMTLLPTGELCAQLTGTVTIAGAGPGGGYQLSYALLTNASASGPSYVVAGSNYLFNITGTFGGATVTVTATSPSGSQTLGTYTSAPASPACFAIAAGTTIQATVSGGSPSGLYATLGGVGAGGCGLTGGSTSVTQGTSPWVVSGSVNGYDSGAVSATATPANSSHAAGVSIGGLFSVAVARTNGSSGIITSFNYKSTGGSTGSLAVRIWQKNPSGTTCTDNTAFSGADADDANLITAPFTITPAAPASTTGDSATYAAVTVVSWDYKNVDTSPGQNLYVCLVTVATDTADENKLVRVQLSGPQN
jgi:hypothetical protein